MLPTRFLYRFERGNTPAIPKGLMGIEEKKRLVEALDSCRIKDSREEIAVLIDIIGRGAAGKERERLLQDVLKLLNRFAHRKYREIFYEALGEMKAFAESRLASARFRAGLERIAERARVRFESPR